MSILTFVKAELRAACTAPDNLFLYVSPSYSNGPNLALAMIRFNDLPLPIGFQTAKVSSQDGPEDVPYGLTDLTQALRTTLHPLMVSLCVKTKEILYV